MPQGDTMDEAGLGGRHPTSFLPASRLCRLQLCLGRPVLFQVRCRPRWAKHRDTCEPVTPGLGSGHSQAGVRPCGPDMGTGKTGLPGPPAPCLHSLPASPGRGIHCKKLPGAGRRNLQAKGSLAVVSWGLQTPISYRGSQGSLGSGMHIRGQGGSKDVAEQRQ